MRKILIRAALTVAAVPVLLVALFAIGVLWPERKLVPIATIAPIAIVGVSVINPAEKIRARDTASVPPAERKAQTVLLSGDRSVTVGDEGTLCKILWRFIKNPVAY